MVYIKEKVRRSGYVKIITVVLTLVLVALGLYYADYRGASDPATVSIWVIIVLIFLGAAYYSPVSVELTDTMLKIHRACSSPKVIHIEEIVKVEKYTRTMADYRYFGYGAFFGYMGWFRSKLTGRYFAYMGDWNDAFLIELKSGRKYMLGCNNPHKIVDALNEMIA